MLTKALVCSTALVHIGTYINTHDLSSKQLSEFAQSQAPSGNLPVISVGRSAVEPTGS